MKKKKSQKFEVSNKVEELSFKINLLSIIGTLLSVRTEPFIIQIIKLLTLKGISRKVEATWP